MMVLCILLVCISSKFENAPKLLLVLALVLGCEFLFTSFSELGVKFSAVMAVLSAVFTLGFAFRRSGNVGEAAPPTLSEALAYAKSSAQGENDRTDRLWKIQTEMDKAGFSYHGPEQGQDDEANYSAK